MQSHPLLSSPKMRRQESLQQSRRNILIAGFIFAICGALSIYYFFIFNNGGRVTSSPQSAVPGLRTTFALQISTDDGAVLPGLKPTLEGQSERFELEDAQLDGATMLGSQRDTSMGVRESMGLSEDVESTYMKKAKSKKKSNTTDTADTADTTEESNTTRTKRVIVKFEDDKISSSTDGEDLASFPVCDHELSEIVPCLERKLHKKMKLKISTKLMEHYERHCPSSAYRVRCLVPPPTGYKTPIKWPASRDEVWVANVPHTFLATEKSDQRWMVVEGDKVKFPGGGTHFHDGADKYIEGLGKMLGSEEGDLSLGGKIRTALDIGCGVASFGGYLLAQNVLTMSVAPNDVHQNQIQFALERGIPAWLGVLGTQRLPFPSKSFELAHCSRCRIDWAQRDGILLLELDRLLRPGGYWAWSAPPAYRNDDESKQIWKEVTDVTNRLCWKIAAQEGQTVIFQKPLDETCYSEREEAIPPLCSTSDASPDEAWYTKFTPCISEMPVKGEYSLKPWPKRLKNLPPRLPNVDQEAYVADLDVWKVRVQDYLKQIGSSSIEFLEDKNSIRNVMDLKAHMGGFGAAITLARDVWVMNVAPPESNDLVTIYDRGMLGIYHNWCEEFSTYPRTYDLLHAWTVVADVAKNGCSVDDFLLEADRILRPQGYIIFRDAPEYISLVEKRLQALQWEMVTLGLAKEDALNKGADLPEQILIAQKTVWEGDAVDSK